MINSFNGYYRMDTMANGVINPVWVEYPLAVKVSKWVCLLVLIGIVITFCLSLAKPFLYYGTEGLYWGLMNPVNFIFLPIAGVCIWALKLKG